jgi:2-oxoglutarate ferredoxin oxidoreductase subunit beta
MGEVSRMSQTPVYTRPKSLRETSMSYCPGCGHGILHKLIAELIDELELRARMVGVAPVGCAVTAYDYLDVDFAEAAHGRAPAVATGIKRARPDVFVLAYQGDGDLASIGMAEIIHAASRGENYTTVFVNNTVYGMTGGQMAPTTMLGQVTATTPKGRSPAGEGYPLQISELLAILPGATYVERCALSGPAQVRKTKKAIRHGFELQAEGAKGLSLVEVLSPCPTYWRMSPAKAIQWIESEMTKVFPLGRMRG